MSRAGNVWDNAVMESFFSSLKTARPVGKMYRTRAQADVFDDIECFYNPRRRHFTLGYLNPMEFERQANERRLVSIKPAAGQSFSPIELLCWRDSKSHSRTICFSLPLPRKPLDMISHPHLV